MTLPLSEDGPEREILLRALRDYSDSCEEPQLMHGCPFRIVSNGTPTCFEECKELLGKYNAPTGTEVLDVGEFQLVRRRPTRPRRRPPRSAKAFDAREIRMSEAGSHTAWKTTSLINELQTQLCQPPGDLERGEAIESTMEALRQRGVDVELLVKDGMAATIGVHVAMSVWLPEVIRHGAEQGDERARELLAELPPPPTSWRDVVGLVSVEGGELKSGVHPGSFETWIRRLSLDDIIDWRAPATHEELESLPRPTEAAGGVHRWLVDRFTATYLDAWATSSLIFEFKYQRGLRPAPCPDEVMRERSIDELALQRAHIERVAGEPPRHRSHLVPYVQTAVELLEAGRRAAAAQLFEAVLLADPEHAEAHNNLGFCLLPDHPDQALTHLTRAADLGLKYPVLWANRILALARTNRLTSAVGLAGGLLDAVAEMQPSSSWVWRWDGSSPTSELKLENVTDLRVHLCELCICVADLAENAEMAAAWRRVLGGIA